MLKKYTATTEVAVNIKINGGNKHISFSPVTLGGSNYYTSNEAEQKGLEGHYRYGELFVGEEVPEEVVAENSDEEVTSTVREIEVSCIEDAKDYLAENFGESRTQMRSTKSIKKLAATHNILFKGEDFKDKE